MCEYIILEDLLYGQVHLWYELQGDYYIPCLILSEEETTAYRVMGATPQAVSKGA